MKDIDRLSRDEIKKEIIKGFNSKKRFNPPNVTNTWGQDIKLGLGKKTRREEVEDIEGAKVVLQMRLGTLTTNKEPTRWKKTPEHNIGKCVGYLNNTDENYWHLLTDCEGYYPVLEKYLGQQVEKIKKRAPNKWKLITLRLFFASGREGLSKKEQKDSRNAVREFWEEVQRIRKQQIKNFLVREN
ncbi:hypothetical protein NUSPORA_02832 [Nucleospora cyclopteri]